MLQELRRCNRQVPLVLSVPPNARGAQNDLALIREALGRREARQTARHNPAPLTDCEFRVYSQSGQEFLAKLPILEV